MRQPSPSRPVVRPSLPPHLQQEAKAINARKAKQLARGMKIRNMFGPMLLVFGMLAGILLLVSLLVGLQYWLLEHSTMHSDLRLIAFCAITSLEIFLVSRFVASGDNVFQTILGIMAGIAQGGVLTMILILGAHLLGVDFRVIEYHEFTGGRGIPVLQGIVAQVPWWYLVLATLLTGIALLTARQEDSLHWTMGFSLPFFGSLAYLIGKFALDTGNWDKWF